jgi:hypothetical protein
MRLLDWLRKQCRPARPAAVSFDETAVCCERSDGLVESVQWSDLQEVYLLTTDAGPRMDDVFWVLSGTASGCVVPSEAVGAAELIARLQQLPGFDNRAVIDAMASMERRQFLCWQRGEAPREEHGERHSPHEGGS